jgi:hypothetical protein
MRNPLRFELQFRKKEKPPAICMTEGLTEVVRTGIEPVFHP